MRDILPCLLEIQVVYIALTPFIFLFISNPAAYERGGFEYLYQSNRHFTQCSTRSYSTDEVVSDWSQLTNFINLPDSHRRLSIQVALERTLFKQVKSKDSFFDLEMS